MPASGETRIKNPRYMVCTVSTVLARKTLARAQIGFQTKALKFIVFFGVAMLFGVAMPFSRVRQIGAVVLIAFLAFMFAGCEQTADVAQQKTLSVPSSDQDVEWKQFVDDVARSKRIMGKTKSIYVRFLATTEDTKGHLRDTQQSFKRGVEPGTLMVFGSYNSRNMADLLVDAFNTEYIDGKLTGARLVFVGQRTDEARVKAASVKSGVTFEFYPVD